MDMTLFKSISQLKTPSACDEFFSRIFTPEELLKIACRFKKMQLNENVRIAVQSKGRLADSSLAFLSSVGLIFKPNGRNCMVSCENYPVDMLFLRDDDIPRYVSRGIADFGIVGENVLKEENEKVQIIKRLDFGLCSLVIAAAQGSSIRRIEDLSKKRIATSYPSSLRAYLKKCNIKATVIELKGSVEIAPNLNLADAICDLTQTGKTLKENGLRPILRIFESQAILIQTPKKTKRNVEEMQQLFNFNEKSL